MEPQNQFHDAPQPPSKPDGTLSLPQMWEKIRQSRFFPVVSLVILAVIILGLAFAVVGLIRQFGGSGGPSLKPVKGPENVSYQLGGAELKLSLLRAAYYEEYEGSKPMAPGRKFVIVDFIIENTGDAASGAFTNDDMRLITADGSIMKPSGWVPSGFLNTGVGAKAKKNGKVIFDIDERNAQQPLNLYQIAFGRNVGSRQQYQLSERSYEPTTTPQPTPQPVQEAAPQETGTTEPNADQ